MDYKAKTFQVRIVTSPLLENSMVVKKCRTSTPDSDSGNILTRKTYSTQEKKSSAPTYYTSKRINGDRTNSKTITHKSNRPLSTVGRNKNNDNYPRIIMVTTETKVQSDLDESKNKNNFVAQSTPLNETIPAILKDVNRNLDTSDDKNINIELEKTTSKHYQISEVNNLKKETDEKPSNDEERFDLFDKIKDSVTPLNIGPLSSSFQSCRFELPYDLSILETMTPLDYLSQYCRLSRLRQHQFKKVFDKYRNRYYIFKSSYLYSSIVFLYKEHFTHATFNYLCQLIDLKNQEYDLKFDTYVGILALCERIVYYSLGISSDENGLQLTKNALERCDFYGLDRKLDEYNISETLKRLLRVL